MALPLSKLLRVNQWVKNLFVMAPIFFSMNFFNIQLWWASLLASLSFCLLSSSVYIINDLFDKDEDRHHPTKKNRPISSGAINTKQALIIFSLIFSLGILLSFFLPIGFAKIITTYLLIQLSYTFFFKRQPIFDILIIASGFVLRVLAGSHAISVPASPYIILTTFLLALYLIIGKRYYEFNLPDYNEKRESLKGYNKEILGVLLSISCGLTILSYALYTIDMSQKNGSTSLIYTCIFVIFGLFKYLQNIYLTKESGNPEKIFIKDKYFIANGLLWFTITLWIIYFR